MFSIPCFFNCSTIMAITGLPLTGNNGFGVSFVNSPNLEPRPPAIITAMFERFSPAIKSFKRTSLKTRLSLSISGRCFIERLDIIKSNSSSEVFNSAVIGFGFISSFMGSFKL